MTTFMEISKVKKVQIKVVKSQKMSLTSPYWIFLHIFSYISHSFSFSYLYTFNTYLCMCIVYSVRTTSNMISLIKKYFRSLLAMELWLNTPNTVKCYNYRETSAKIFASGSQKLVWPNQINSKFMVSKCC